MTREKAMMMAEQINTASFNTYAPSRVHAEVIENIGDFEVKVEPAETNVLKTGFYHIDELGIMAHGYNVHIYAIIENAAIIAKIF